jgi:hypothetical protein
MPTFATHLALAAVAAVAALAAGARPAFAQLTFAWADSAPRVERYTTPEECLAAAWRLRRVALEHGEVWRDTMPLTEAEARERLPESVVGTARTCGGRFDPATTPVEDYLPVTMLYLLAYRDADAEALVKRRLAAIAPTAEGDRAAVLDTVLAVYLEQNNRSTLRETNFLRVQPARIAMAEPRLKELAGLKAATWQQRHRGYVRMLLAAKDVGDSVRLRWAAKEVVAIGPTISSADQRKDEYSEYVRHSFQAMEILAGDSLLDSLRRSTAAYVALQRANWAKASGERPEALRMPIGQAAPAVQGDFWFRRGDSVAARPTKGKVGLVAFLEHENEAYCVLSGNCYRAAAVLHRVAERFPDVEITLVARTRGYFSRSVPLEPAAEADTLAHWWLERHDVPGAFAVTATDFWRLPAPDSRRIDRERPNEVNYSFGRHWPVQPLSAYLIDRRGTIVAALRLTDRTVGEELRKLLEAIQMQPVASR